MTDDNIRAFVDDEEARRGPARAERSGLASSRDDLPGGLGSPAAARAPDVVISVNRIAG